MALFEIFNETIFVKENSELAWKLNELVKLKGKVKEKDKLEKEMQMAQLGLQGENKVRFELENANIGMYVLHDVTLQYEDMYAQIDYIVITKAGTYFVECKNLFGNISVTSDGEFRREYYYNKKRIKESIYSPYTQAKRHVVLFKKMWQSSNSKFMRLLANNAFDRFHKPLVVLANSDGILNLRYAPAEIKRATIKVDQLIKYLEKDIENTSKIDYRTKKDMEEIATMFLKLNVKRNINYAEKYTILDENMNDKEVKQDKEQKNDLKEVVKSADELLREQLVEYRKTKSKEKHLPAYYIFKNEQLDKLIELKPKTIEELKSYNILEEVKVKLHGEEIVTIIAALS